MSTTRPLGFLTILLLFLISATCFTMAAGERVRPSPHAWEGRAFRSIREMEYEVTADSSGTLKAVNRNQDLRITFRQDRIEIGRRTRPEGLWSLTLAPGRGHSAPPRANGRHVTYHHTPIHHEWDNAGAGVRFTLTVPALGDSNGEEMDLDLRTGLEPISSADGSEVSYYLYGQRQLRITLDRLTGEQGAPLSARLVATDRSLMIRSDPAGTAGTVTASLTLRGPGSALTGQGLSPTPDWFTDGGQDTAQYGWSVSTAGDVNGDGYSDAIIGAIGADNGEFDEGMAYLFLGSASGLSYSPAWIGESNQVNALLGSVSTAGDVNGDGFDDVIAGAMYYDGSHINNGKVYLYLGGPGGLAVTPVWTAEGGNDGALMGDFVSTAGDVNGDGLDDIIVGAYRSWNGEFSEGKALVFLGTDSGSGVETPAVWEAEGNQVNAEYGQSVFTAGDVNGDGYSDIVVGALQYSNGEDKEGRVFVYHGSPSGPSPTPDWTYESNQVRAFLGFSVGPAGDVNGDGYSDLLVGSDYFDDGENNEGRAFLFFGSAAGLSTEPDWTYDGNQADAIAGKQVGTAGDINGDGYSDIIIGMRGYSNGETNEGRAVIFLGSATGPRDLPDWTAESNQAYARYGGSAFSAGDLNGDGFGDVIVSASLYDGTETDEGRVYVYHGATTGFSGTSSSHLEGDQDGAGFGFSVDGAGDVNGDGYADVIVGAADYDAGEPDEGAAFLFFGSAAGLPSLPDWWIESDQEGARLGAAVAAAGDIDGDGYGDVILGAPGFDAGETDEGAVFLYRGSVTGLEATPFWSGEGDQPGAAFGAAVGPAGDVNGDGVGDFLVGAPGHDDGEMDEGRVYCYPGSSAGPPGMTPWIFDSNQTGAGLGWAVATAGDINGDGYADFLAGAPHLDGAGTDSGGALLFRGSYAGPMTTPTWILFESQPGAGMGMAVASAGDVNGDGFSDILVGAPFYDTVYEDAGRVILLQGAPGGLPLQPDWFQEGTQTGMQLGSSVSRAGDVNGDGFGDIAVGAPGFDDALGDEGIVYVLYGSAAGVAALPSWSWRGVQPGERFGTWVAMAGDITGDGYADLLVGAPGFDGIGPDQGAVSVFWGNQGPGLPLDVRQMTADGSTPIPLQGLTQPTGAFRVEATGRNPMGRSRVSLEWEIKPLGTPFDGTDTHNGFESETGTPSSAGSTVVLSTLLDGLEDGQMLHWRVRQLGNWPYFPRSRWFSPAGAGPQEMHLRVPGCSDLDQDGYGSRPDPLCDGGLVVDCDETLADVWSQPGAAGEILLSHESLPAVTTLTWGAPEESGGTTVSYDVLRTQQADDFEAAATCVMSEGSATTLLDTDLPSGNSIFYYLVRTRNECPAPLGSGSLGSTSSGVERTGRTCP